MHKALKICSSFASRIGIEFVFPKYISIPFHSKQNLDLKSI
jgi:hypothetical protein